MTISRPWQAGAKRKTLIAAALMAAMAYVAVALITSASQLVGALKQLGSLGCCGVLGLSVVNYLLRFCRWSGFMLKLGHHPPLIRNFLYYLSGFAFTVSPAKAGEAVRSLYLRNQGVSYPESLAALFVERLLDLLAIVILASLVALDSRTYRVLVVASLPLLGIVIVAVCHPLVPIWIGRMTAVFTGAMARLTAATTTLLRSSQQLLDPRSLTWAALLGLLAWGAEGLGFGLICHALNISGAVWSFCGIYALAVLAGAAAFVLPAGIGGTEIVMTTLLVGRGAPLPVAIVATLLCRVATLWFAVLLGIGACIAVELSDQKLSIEAAN